MTRERRRLIRGVAFTPDGKTVIYIELSASTSYDIYAVDVVGDRKPRPLLTSQFDERRPSLSPDGKWFVYQSNESGQFEVFVRPFPNVDGGRWQVSAGGGSSPIWSPDGREIFYRQGQTIQRVAVQTAPSFSAGTPSQLFQTLLPVDSAGMSYAIGPDGKRQHTYDYREGGCRQVKNAEVSANLGWAMPGTGSAMVMRRG